MTTDEERQREIREIAYEVGNHLSDKLRTEFAAQVRLHQAECPLRAQVQEARGAWKVVSVVAASVGALVSAAISHFWK